MMDYSVRFNVISTFLDSTFVQAYSWLNRTVDSVIRCIIFVEGIEDME